jgi:hypothetical protein
LLEEGVFGSPLEKVLVSVLRDLNHVSLDE